MKLKPIILLTLLMCYTLCHAQQNTDSMLIRISEIEVYPQYMNEYLAAAKTVGATSVKEEPGVICIFPMQLKRNRNLIRIVEIYASMEAYHQHIGTTHFQTYKQKTLHMVKSLDLIDMESLDPKGMPLIFLKMNVDKQNME